MRHSPLRLLGLAALLASAPLTRAGFAQDSLTQLVPADAKFACYIDLQAAIDFVGRDLLESAITRHVSGANGIKLRRDWNERLAKDWGIDPLRDLQGLLLFGTELEREDPKIVLLTSDSIDAVLEKLSDMGALEREERDGVAIDRIAPGKLLAAFGADEGAVEGEAYLHVRKLRGQGPQRAVMFGASRERLLPSVQALSGRPARGQQSPLALTPKKGCIAYLEVADALQGALGRTPASRMASKTKHFTMQLSEAAGEIEFTAALQTESAKDARQIAALVNGLKALVSLVEPDADVPEGVLEALNDAHAEADGSTVALEFRLARSILDEARNAVRRELQGRGEQDRDDDEPKAGARRKRSIR